MLRTTKTTWTTRTDTDGHGRHGRNGLNGLDGQFGSGKWEIGCGKWGGIGFWGNAGDQGDGAVDGLERKIGDGGAGGDGAHTFNISTAAAFVMAGAGRRVAKHGNRAASSHCGAADVLAALGVSLDLTAEQVGKAIDDIGIGFMSEILSDAITGLKL